MAEVAGQTVVDGRYRITGRIGSGGMADVYCADDTHLGREVAIKILHRRFSQDEEFVERFRREASAAAGLQHPNVVAVFDRGSHDDTWYIAMERLKGRTLKQLIADDAPVDQRRAINLTIQVLQAAGFAHKRGVVHRDFKPHNVIVGDNDAVKVTDFGIARAGASEMTETGSIMGTAQYLSPEQAQGQRVDARSDLYSIGIMLFELLTSRVPFNGESAVSIALKHVSEPAPPVTSARPDIHPALEAIIARSLVKDPAGRFQSAEEFILALDDARRAITAGGPGEHTAKYAPVVGPPLPPYGDEGDDRGRGKWPFVALALVILALLGFGAFLLLDQPAQVKVPNVVTLDVAAATRKLEARGFKVDTRQARNSAKPGVVLSSQPGQGKTADKGSTVTLTVSSGPGQVVVPDVTGFSQGRAQRTLAKLGFQYDQQLKSSATIPKDRVIKTRPGASETVDYGSRVVIVVSTGPKQVQVPRVVGLTQSSAVKLLEASGLTVSVTEAPSDKPTGEVIQQNPGQGAQVDEGSTVTLTVSKGREQVAVPDTTGKKEAEARTILEGAGFRVKVVDQSTTDPLVEGVVLSQQPSTGNKSKGSSITIVVGRATNGGTGGNGVGVPPPPNGAGP
ncbi:MAG: eukaryotic-like serine/threonine-protein kinase [Thermoleophilales bacterium]|nr:eukaryotic-like serine/threonine-protein kinase [Thermoleophilales bacterium]